MQTILEAALAAGLEERAKLRPFLINIGPRGNPRLSFGCMAADSFTAQMQHLDLAEAGERVEVVPVGEDSFRLRSVRHELEQARLAEVSA